MEYCCTHICREKTDTQDRHGYLFGVYIKDGEPLQAVCPGCGEITTDCIPMGRNSLKRHLGVIQDIEPYKSPIDGKMITSRSGHRDHCRQHGVIEMGNEYPKERETNNAPMNRAGQDIVQAMGGR